MVRIHLPCSQQVITEVKGGPLLPPVVNNSPLRSVVTSWINTGLLILRESSLTCSRWVSDPVGLIYILSSVLLHYNHPPHCLKVDSSFLTKNTNQGGSVRHKTFHNFSSWSSKNSTSTNLFFQTIITIAALILRF